MNQYKKQAKELAKFGRYGDDMLLHVSKEELRGLASLHPEGKLPKNPDTGMPEAFFFLPFLAGIGSIMGGAAATGATLGATTAAASALPAAAATALPAAATTAASTALPAAATATLPTAATAALPAAATTATQTAAAPLFSGALQAAANPAAVTSLAGPTANTLAASSGLPSLATQGATATVPTTATAPASAAITATAPSTATSAMPGATATVPGVLEGPVNAATNTGGMLGGMNMNQMLQYGALASLMGGGGGTEMEEEDGPKLKRTNYSRGRPNFNFKGGDGEHNFFPNARYYAGGGLVRKEPGFNPPTTNRQPPQQMQPMSMQTAQALSAPLNPMMTGHYAGMMEPSRFLSANNSAEDVVSMMNGTWIHPMFAAAVAEEEPGRRVERDRKYAEGGLASLDNLSEEPAPQGGAPDDRQLIEATKQAIVSQSPDAEQLIQLFVATFGKQALEHLLQSLQSGGDGLSDSVPAQITDNAGNQGLASLSEGEYVVPSDVVSGLGNGSTEAGARQLEEMQNRVRSARGTPSRPPMIDPNEVMPA